MDLTEILNLSVLAGNKRQYAIYMIKTIIREY